MGKPPVATNISGESTIKPVKEGLYDIWVTMPGYEDFVLLQYQVVREKINRITVELVAVPVVFLWGRKQWLIGVISGCAITAVISQGK